ncbi:MAG TPA: hypothetical protein VGR00_13900, partial [Thermoanaerobaculia bacterium]|nr:hypothetical protein [Thermoanaerobaculia bacterium]
MRFRAFPLASPLLLASLLVAADKVDSLVIWPGYVVGVPPGHCVAQQNGPDFHVLYFRDQSPQHVNLVGVYAGHHPDFKPECKSPKSRKWTADGLAFESVRGADVCAEFLVHDTANERGFLHIWFCPGA